MDTIHVGLVGPPRAGKSTLIRMMQQQQASAKLHVQVATHPSPALDVVCVVVDGSQELVDVKALSCGHRNVILVLHKSDLERSESVRAAVRDFQFVNTTVHSMASVAVLVEFIVVVHKTARDRRRCVCL